jgi:ATP-dependent helicase/nuclease subunit A
MTFPHCGISGSCAVAESRPPPPDQKHRDQVSGDLDRTMLVEAAAGTGKTTCLIARMVGLLREGKCRVETLAAVTFTRKAAAELRTRFQLGLEKAAVESSGEGRERLLEALEHVERCFIGTIHSFCARLLRERPVEAGLDPGFIELDDAIDTQFRRQAWREHVAELIATDDAVLPELEHLGLKVTGSTRRSHSIATELEELGLQPAELGPAFLTFAEFTDVEDWPSPVVPLPDLGESIEAVRGYADHMRSLSLPADPGNDSLMPKYELIGRMEQRLDLDQPAQFMELLEQFNSSAKVVQKMWPSGKLQALQEQQRWDDFREQYAEPLLLAWREHRYEPVMRAIRPALEVYARLRRERNALNFQDLLLQAARLLRQNPEVRRYFRERFTHLLVDEFQDTDPIQAEVMLLLTAEDHRETVWLKCRPVPGSLFVVGDPKQSIYRFRRADILTYNKVRDIIRNVGGEVVPLTANFRSCRPVIDWVNGCFRDVFPAEADDYSPADRPLEVGRTDGDADSGVEKLQTAGSRNDEIAALEADRIARSIRRAIDEQWPVSRPDAELKRGLPPHAQAGDFLIVARSKARLTIYARALQKYGLPHTVTGGKVLNEVPELELLHVCLAAVTRSDDPVALVAALRSELFGVSDTALYDFRRLGGRFSYLSDIPDGIDADDTAVIRDAFDRLRTCSRWLRRMPAVAAIEWIAADQGLFARACAAEEGDAHAGSFLKAIELLRSLDGQWTVGDVVDALQRFVGLEEPHDGVPVRPPTEMPVRVMNLHQCKGLEAPFVFLVDPSGESVHDVGVHIDRSGESPRGFLPIYGPKRSQWGSPPILARPPDWDTLAAEEQRFLDAENNRLLYVAATRAGVKLVISQRSGKNQKSPWHPFDARLQFAAGFGDPGPVAVKPPVAATFEPSDWATAVAAIDQRWRNVAAPTYAVQGIKEAALTTDAEKPRGAVKGGAEWGTVLHTLLEAAMKQPKADIRGLALSALDDEELPGSLVDDVIETVRRVVATDIWQRAQRAEACLTEVPVALLVDSEDAETGLPTVLCGVIDLVFREAASWVIVDYKSERVGTRDVPALVAYYEPQIDSYADVWAKVVGEPVAERGLLFTHTTQYFPLPSSGT